MGAFPVIVIKPLTESLTELGSVTKRPKVKVLILDRPPKTLDEDIILDSAATVHADGHGMFFQAAGEGLAGELGSLVGVKDLWRCIPAQRFCEGLYTEV